MARTIQDQGNEDLTVNKKKRRGVEEDGENIETEEACRKYGINLGRFRTETEILSELHLKYPVSGMPCSSPRTRDQGNF